MWRECDDTRMSVFFKKTRKLYNMLFPHSHSDQEKNNGYSLREMYACDALEYFLVVFSLFRKMGPVKWA